MKAEAGSCIRKVVTVALALAAAWPGGFGEARAAESLAPGPVVETMPRVETTFAEDGVSFSNGIEGGRLHAVERLGAMSYRLVVRSEAEPVHHSAWYGFAVELKADAELELELVYPQSRHRYAPKWTRDGEEWTEVSEPEGRPGSAEGARVFDLSLKAGRTVVAAQEFMGAEVFDALLGRLKARAGGEVVEAGRSVEGRAMRAWRREPSPGEDRWVVVAGGQHPAEVPGAMGLVAFAERLAELVAGGRAGMGLVVLPVINPDGLAGGHWRFNARGVDLNRSWAEGEFEPETAVAAAFLAEATAGGRVGLFVDFHATEQDVFYTFPDEMEGGAEGLKRRWLDGLARRVPEFRVVEKTGHNPGLAVSRLWARKQWGGAALTFEFGDRTERGLIRRAAEAAADELVELLR